MFEGKMFVWSLWDKVYARQLLCDETILENWPYGHGEDTYINENPPTSGVETISVVGKNIKSWIIAIFFKQLIAEKETVKTHIVSLTILLIKRQSK